MCTMLRGGLLVVLATYVVLAAARRSPQADKLPELLKNVNTRRYSDSVFEDATLDATTSKIEGASQFMPTFYSEKVVPSLLVIPYNGQVPINDFWPDLIRKYRYPVEVHSVTTEDGYILEMHRIPHGRDANNVSNQTKPVVFVMHGLFCSSADFILMGPGSGLGYILAEDGFDVWLGNARGNYYSRKHVTLNPDAILNKAFWKFSWDEIGNIDLPAMIDYILAVSGKEKLHYVGHSQGTTSFFVLGSLRPSYNEKFISMQALAPVAYMAHNKNLLFKVLSSFSYHIESISSLVGIGEFLPNSIILTLAGEAFCRDGVVFQPICSDILFLIGGWDESQLNATMLPVIFGHTPAGSSVRQVGHYAQGIAGKGFRRFDHGSPLANQNAYGSDTPPSYDLSKVTAPVFLHYSTNDPLAEVADVDRLFDELGSKTLARFLVPLKSFTHLDFLYAIDAKTLVYDKVIELIKATDATA